MKKVERIDNITNVDKPIEITHLHSDDGWVEVTNTALIYTERFVYLGKCRGDGDMFIGYEDGHIHLYKGHLNNGTY